MTLTIMGMPWAQLDQETKDGLNDLRGQNFMAAAEGEQRIRAALAALEGANNGV